MRYVKFVLLGALCVWFGGVGEVAANKSGVAPNVLSLPSGPGSLGGVGENVKPNLNMGLMSYQIKVVVPNGRGTATPNPSIRYSSSAGSSIVGIGWNFSAGNRIERMTVRGLPTYTNQDLFALGGELVKIPNSPFYRARIEGGFMRTRWVQKNATDQQGYWIVESPDGSKMYYGANEKGELDLDAHVYGTQGTFRWHLTTYVDRNGNKVRYTYFKDGTQVYPDQIAWVFDDNDKPLYHLKFGYEDRPDHISDGKPGFDLQTTKRLKEVQITSNGQRFRSYHFDFEESTGLSRLIKVTRYGRDPQKAHPIQFTMKYSDATFSPQNSMMVTMPTPLGVDFRTNNLDFVDINGDALPDVVDTSKAKHAFFLNELKLDGDLKQASHDFPQSRLTQNPTEISAKLSSPSVQMLDYNGDGFTDLVDAVNKKVYLNKGDGKWTDSSTSLQVFPVTGKDPNMRFMDYDGDKKIDVISSDGSTTTFWLNDGKGGWSVKPGAMNIGLGFAKDRLRLIDINGDGLQDVVHITKNSLRYRKYLGYGNWSAWISVKVPGIDQYELNINAQFNDMNGDGMADMVGFFGSKIVYFVNKNGTEFEAGKELQAFKGIDIPDATKTSIRLVDINGNGSRDIVWIDSSGKVTYLELFGKRPNLMTAISNGIGQRINIDYGSSVYFYLRDQTCKVGTDKACAGPWQNKMPMAFPTVTRLTTWSSRSDKPLQQATPTKEERPMVQSIYYHDGFYDGIEKKFRGFRKVESLYVGDDSVEDFKQSLTYDVGDKDSYFHGKLLHRIASNNKGHVYNEESFVWQDCGTPAGAEPNLDPPVRFICMKSNERLVKEGLSEQARWKTVRNENEYDGYGNVIVASKLGEKGKDGDEMIKKTTYIAPKDPKSVSSPWFLRLIQKIEICNKTEKHCAELLYFYDGEAYKGLEAGTFGRRGNLIRIAMREAAGKDKFIDVLRRKVDGFGNLTGRKTARGMLRTVTWDEVYHRFSTTETVYLSGVQMKASTKWDYAYGVVTESTSYNGQITTYGYDSFNRLVFTRKPGDPADKPHAAFQYDVQAPISRIITNKRTQTGGDVDRVEVQCFDGQGRKFATAVRLPDGKYLVSNHTEFNARGKKSRTWFSYTSDKDCQFVPPSGVSTTRFFYDGMTRVTKKLLADGSETRVAYEPFRVLSYDEEDTRKDSPFFDTPMVQEVDGLGRVIAQIKDLGKGKKLTTRFTYTNVNTNSKDLCTSVTFPDGSKKTQEYDLLGRTTKLSDPDRGSTTFGYDEDGNTILREEANGVRIVSTFDLLRRVLTREQEGKPETRITYQYDKTLEGLPDAKNLMGRPAGATFPAGHYLYSYDARGNMAQMVVSINGSRFVFKAAYDNLDQLREETFPDGRKVTYNIDTSGRLASVPGHIDKIAYEPNGTVASMTFANGVTTTYKRDKRLRPTVIDAGEGKVMRLGYSYDANGNILSIGERLAGQDLTHTYDYDALYRLTQAKLDGPQKETINYKLDDLDNIAARTSSLADKSPVHLGDYKYDKVKVHAVTQAGAFKMDYDKIGCMTKKGETTYSWDFLHRLTSAQRGGDVVLRNWYGPGEKRVLKDESGVQTLYVAPHYHIRGGRAVIYISAGYDRVVAWSSAKGAATVYPDLAPASGDAKLSPKPDGVLSAADAWLLHAGREKLVTIDLQERPLEVELTRSILQVSLARMLDEGKERKEYYHVDLQGSVRAVSDESGAVLARKTYYPYGMLRSQEGSVFSFGYTGTEKDLSIGANYFKNRFMDTHLGRWMSPDPLYEKFQGTGAEFNSYGVVMANPIRKRDFDGTESFDPLNPSGHLALAVTIGALLWQLTMVLPAANEKLHTKEGPLKGSKLQKFRVYFKYVAFAISAASAAAVGAIKTNPNMSSREKNTVAIAALAVQTMFDGVGSVASFIGARRQFTYDSAQLKLAQQKGGDTTTAGFNRYVGGVKLAGATGGIVGASLMTIGLSVAAIEASGDKDPKIGMTILAIGTTINVISSYVKSSKNAQKFLYKTGQKVRTAWKNRKGAAKN